ncbi:MAG: NB-ARC domain-containing protein, partial [Actinocatenispora sp.]
AELFAALARGRPPGHPVRGPAQLPTDLPDFTGRGRELARLTDLLADPTNEGVRIVVLDGGAGVGKTSLAVRAGHQVRDRFPDGQLYLDLAGGRSHPVSASTALAGFLTALGAEAGERVEGLAARSARYRSVLAGRRVLLLLDDARDAAQVRPLLPAGAGSAVLVTSRSRLPDLVGARHLALGELSGAEAVSLLARVVGGSRVADEQAAAARVVTACGKLPLAVRIAGARLAVRPRWTVASLADRLAAARHRLDELTVGDLAVRASFRLSHDRLDPEHAEMFALLGLWPGHEIPVPAAAALAGLASPRAERLLEELVDRHLLESPAPGRYRQHDLLHAFARELLIDDVGAERSDAALRRLVSFVTATAYQADLMLWPASEPPFPAAAVADPGAVRFTAYTEALTWYAVEWPALAALLRQLTDDPPAPATDASRLASLLTLYPFVRRDFVELERCARQSAVLAELAGDQLLAATAHKRLGIALLEQRRHEEAAHHHELALAAFRAAGARDGEATILNSIGRRLMHEADRAGGDPARYDRARRYLLESLTAAAESGRGSAQVAALCNLGRLEHQVGRDDEAHRHLLRALPLARELGGGQVEAAVVSNLGSVLAGLGRTGEAVGQHERAVTITRQLGDRNGEATALVELSETLLGAGRSAPAAD